MRLEARTFLVDPMLRHTEVRMVDVEDPGAHYPIGTTITCDAGHEVCELRESIALWQEITPSAFGPLRNEQPRHTFKDVKRLDCYCGRPYYAGGKLHTRNGWNNYRPPWSPPQVSERPMTRIQWIMRVLGVPNVR